MNLFTVILHYGAVERTMRLHRQYREGLGERGKRAGRCPAPRKGLAP